MPTTPELITYAQMLNRHYDRSEPVPTGWSFRHKNRIGPSPLDAYVFEKDDESTIVIAIKGVEIYDPRDVIATPLRRTFGYADFNQRFVRDATRKFPNRVLIIVGHSGGGGLASWLGWLFSCVTVCYNSGRVSPSVFNRRRHSFMNSGARQTIVRISGDIWSDPAANPNLGDELPGTLIELDPIEGEDSHAMSTIIAALQLL